MPIARPEADEHLAYYGRYIALVPGTELLPELARSPSAFARAIASLDDAAAMHRYEPGRWSIKEMIQHVIDTERVMSYRALRFARADQTPLPGFEQDEWAPFAGADRRPIAALRADFAATRASTLALFESIDEEASRRRGEAAGHPVTVRALGYIIAGHELHHVNVLRERYGVGA